MSRRGHPHRTRTKHSTPQHPAASDPCLATTPRAFAATPPASAIKTNASTPDITVRPGLPLLSVLTLASTAEQSSSEGFLIEDVLHLHDGSEAVPFRFGCETRETGEIFRQEADGIMGLGNSDASIINQVRFERRTMPSLTPRTAGCFEEN